MPALEIVGLGLCTIDVLTRLDTMPCWERGGRARELRLDGGGPVGTGIAAAARLGARTGYIGTRGNDETGAFKLALLERDGVDTSRVICRDTPESQIVICFVQQDTGERVFTIAETVSSALLRPEELDRAYLTQAEYLHIDGFHHEAALQAAEWMHSAGKKVMLDAAKCSGKVDRRMRALVAVTDILICGSGFGLALTGRLNRWEAGEALLDLGPRIVVQTEGETGSYTLTESDRFHTPAFCVNALDTTGAGDVFHGAYLYGLTRGWSLENIAVFASAVAAIKCTRLGGRNGIPYRSEVTAFLREQGIAFDDLLL